MGRRWMEWICKELVLSDAERRLMKLVYKHVACVGLPWKTHRRGAPEGERRLSKASRCSLRAGARSLQQPRPLLCPGSRGQENVRTTKTARRRRNWEEWLTKQNGRPGIWRRLRRTRILQGKIHFQGKDTPAFICFIYLFTSFFSFVLLVFFSLFSPSSALSSFPFLFFILILYSFILHRVSSSPLFTTAAIAQPIPVAARSKARVCDRSLAEVAGSNPAGGMDICVVCAVQ